MPSRYDQREQRRAQTAAALAALRKGKGAIEACAESGLPLAECKQLAAEREAQREAGAVPISTGSVISVRAQRAELVRVLGRERVNRLAPESDPVATLRLYADYRSEILDAGEHREEIRDALRAGDRANLVSLASRVGDAPAAAVGNEVIAWGRAKRVGFRGAREGRS